MIDAGVNSNIINSSPYGTWSLSDVSNIPTTKSVYFLVKKFRIFNYDPWFYESGVFPAEYNDSIGFGGEGSVIGAEYNGIEVALKYVEIKQKEWNKMQNTKEVWLDLESQLNEMNQMNSVKGTSILKLIGHFRLVF